MNTLIYNDQRINIGPTPLIVRQCGFANPDDVRRVANKNSISTPSMRMGDVIKWFQDHPQG